jgi:hypothetical protein
MKIFGNQENMPNKMQSQSIDFETDLNGNNVYKME